MDEPNPSSPSDAIKDALFAGRKIEAIKLFREQHGVGLAEAKAAIEALETQLRAASPERFSQAQSKGCFSVVLMLVLVATALFTFAGCATLNHRDRNFLQSHGVSGALYDKMSHHEPLTVAEIITLWRKGVPGPFIVHYLQPTYYVYKLDFADVNELRQAGVDEGVIRYLQATPHMFSPGSVPTWVDDNYRLYDTHPGLYPGYPY